MTHTQSSDGIPYRRKRGAQPGNLNAMRHGRYAFVDTQEDYSGLDPLCLKDVDVSIAMLKKLMHVVYQAGLTAKTLVEVNETLRVLTMASTSYTRLLNLRARMAKQSKGTVLNNV